VNKVLLKSVTALGFKSFADKIEFDFGSGITAVVGPNGSGKSNISDAVRWVLGEQSAKYLRGTKMEDVIFNGTSKRRPLGVAEVNLVLDNSDHKLPLDYDEVSITRRLFRSGESEYAINKNTCRLKDLQDLMADTGLGRGSMSIIGQNKIDEILNSRAEDRRAIFEEAAGIAKYRLRKKEASRRLENTANNLLRINDIKTEVEGQVEPLRIESEKTTKYNDLSAQLRSCKLTQFVRKVDTIDEAKAKLATAREAAEKNLVEKTTAMGQAQAECTRLQQEIDKLNDAYSALQDAIKEKETGLEKLRGLVAVLDERVAQSQKQTTLVDKRMAGLRPQIENWDAELKRLAGEFDEIESAKRAAIQKVEKIVADATARQNAIEDGQHKLQELTDNNFEEMRQMVELRNNIRAAEQEQEQRMRRREALKQEVSDLEAKLTELQTQQKSMQNEQGEVQQKMERYARESQDTAAEAEKINKELSEIVTGYDACQKEVTGVESRLNVLSHMQENYEGFGHGIKAVVGAQEGWKDQVLGVMAALLKVPEEYVTAMEVALGGGAQNIVMENAEAAKKAIAYLKANKSGRVTFLPLDTLKVRPVSADEQNLCHIKGVRGFAADLLGFDKKIAPAVKFLLGRTLIADDMDMALEAAKASDFKLKVVTLAGDIVHAGGSMTGGSRQQREAGYLSRQKTIAELERQLEKLNTTLLSWQEKRETKEDTLAAINEKQENYKKSIQESQVRLAELGATLTRMTSNLNDENQRLQLAMTDRKSLAEEYMAKREEIQKLQPQLAAMESKNADAKKLLDDVQGKINADNSALTTLNNQLQDAKVDQASLEERSKATSDRMQDIDNNLGRLQEEMANNEKEKERLAQVVANSGTDKEKLRLDTEKLMQELKDITSGKDDFSGKKVELAEASAKANEQLTLVVSEKAKAEAKVHQNDVDQGRLDADYQNALNQLDTEYKMTLEEARASGLLHDQSDTALRRSEVKLQREIEALGPINMAAIEQYQATKDRFEFLQKQYADLESAKSDLETVIAEINSGMTKRFKEAFAQINVFFADTYKKLFGGGTAVLKLTDPDDFLESGIDIEVQPPGKRLQSLFLLSGGERALTVIALLFALLSYKPSPFCILDEIDAPLDDANIGRFAKFLLDYSKQTQFIVITHRKGTMEAANIMYGITMEELGVSKLLSVKMNERK
jgi:chromosome segregation protein